jgi:hypothetical protein
MSLDSADQEVLALLPDELRQIAEIIGVDAALKLVIARGGTSLYVPIEMTADHAIAGLIGMEAGRALSKIYQGEKIEIPRALGWRSAIRDLLIYQQSKTDSQSKLAIRHGLTVRSIRNAMRRAEDRLGSGSALVRQG